MRYEDLVDGEGENQAVRAFLMLYGTSSQPKITAMKAFLSSMGFEGAWPDWANDESIKGLTKTGAQLWLRYLFDLEEK